MEQLVSEKLCECGCGQATSITPFSNAALGWVKGKPRRFVHGHHSRRPLSRIFEEENYSVDDNECWVWAHGKDKNGYGRISGSQVHRVSYRLSKGKIKTGLVIDHLCNNPSCFNPDHLEAVTNKENIRRSCVRAGELTKEEILCLIHDKRSSLKKNWSGEEYLEDEQGCWIWMKGMSSRGYGRRYNKDTRETQYAHRFFYEESAGVIPKGYVVDHLCGIHICVNPDHLEAVTNEENVRRRWAKRKEIKSG